MIQITQAEAIERIKTLSWSYKNDVAISEKALAGKRKCDRAWHELRITVRTQDAATLDMALERMGAGQ